MITPTGSMDNTRFDPERQTLVVGLGKTGLSCVRFLVKKGVAVAIVDSREMPPGLDVLREEFPDVAVFVGGFSEEAFASAQQLVISPGVSLKEPQIQSALHHGIPVISDIELFATYAKAPIIAITGTNGKSTVTSLVGLMAVKAGKNVRIGGNLGTPALDLIDENDETELYVLELSSFQLDSTNHMNAAVAAVLNVSPDHMDRYDSVQHYITSKQKIYQGSGVMVMNRDDHEVMAMSIPGRKIITFGLGEPEEKEFGIRNRKGGYWIVYGDKDLIKTSELLIRGKHNLSNALAALAIGRAAEFPLPAMLDALQSFRGLPHRMQWVAETDGVNWYNDSKGTNPGATVAALRGLSEPVVLIAGGDGKGADFSPIREAVVHHCRAVVLIGRDAPQIEKILSGLVSLVQANDMKEAVVRARELSQPGDVVLLSPACASFDMFSDYKARGDAFVQAVQGLAA